MPNVAVVGDGMLGLTLALRLRQRGFDVTVFEAGYQPSGLTAPATIGPYSWDRFPHVFVRSDHHLRRLLQELGIAHRLHWGITRTGFHVDGRLHSLSSTLDFLLFPPLGVIDKARLALTVLRAAHVRDPAALDAISAGEWLRRWSGERTYNRIWLPLLKAQLGDNHSQVSAAFIWSIVSRKYAARLPGQNRELFGYVQGGYATILEALCERLADVEVRVEPNAPVCRVIDDSEGATVLLKNGRIASFDHVVVTTPGPITARLCPQLSDAERARLEGVPYQGIACMSVLLRRPLGDFYITNIATPGMPFTAVIEMTALVPRSTFDGFSLVYLPRYLAQDDSYWSLSDETIRHRFLSGLGAMYPQLAKSDVVATEISRARHVLPLLTRHDSRDVMASVTTSRPRLHLGNSAQIAHGSLNVNETVGLANEQAERLAAHLAPHEVRVHTPWPAMPASSAELVV